MAENEGWWWWERMGRRENNGPCDGSARVGEKSSHIVDPSLVPVSRFGGDPPRRDGPRPRATQHNASFAKADLDTPTPRGWGTIRGEIPTTRRRRSHPIPPSRGVGIGKARAKKRKRMNARTPSVSVQESSLVLSRPRFRFSPVDRVRRAIVRFRPLEGEEFVPRCQGRPCPTCRARTKAGAHHMSLRGVFVVSHLDRASNALLHHVYHALHAPLSCDLVCPPLGGGNGRDGKSRWARPLGSVLDRTRSFPPRVSIDVPFDAGIGSVPRRGSVVPLPSLEPGLVPRGGERGESSDGPTTSPIQTVQRQLAAPFASRRSRTARFGGRKAKGRCRRKRREAPWRI